MNIDLLVAINERFLETPFYGVQQMTLSLRNEGCVVNYKRNLTLMPHARLIPIYQKPNISKAAKGQKTYSNLLGGLRMEWPNQVWCADITKTPMRRSFVFLVAITDWHTWKVLAWRISKTLKADFCIGALNEAFRKCGPSKIMNTDQGSQLTFFVWIDWLKWVGARISTDGKERCIDNIFTERLWRSLNDECVYLHAWEPGSQARVSIGHWITFYNHKRPHTAHSGQTPAFVYFNTIETDQQVHAVA